MTLTPVQGRVRLAHVDLNHILHYTPLVPCRALGVSRRGSAVVSADNSMLSYLNRIDIPLIHYEKAPYFLFPVSREATHREVIVRAICQTDWPDDMPGGQ
ncbi:MAG: hypothetical protein U1E70_13035 [Acetobacteraceae bacterium]